MMATALPLTRSAALYEKTGRRMPKKGVRRLVKFILICTVIEPSPRISPSIPLAIRNQSSTDGAAAAQP